MSGDPSLLPPLAGGDRLERYWADVGTPTRQTVWRHIRALRYRPPGRAVRGERKQIFGSALEQAEQLFSAAEAVGYASRPLLLFYGLSQAGRAVAAASKAVDNKHYKLVRHGIQTRDQGQKELHKVKVVNYGTGSFTQLAPLLRSGTLQEEVPLGQLWAAIPELRDTPILAANTEYLPVLDYQLHDGSDRELTGLINRLPIRFAESATHQELTDFLSAYPTLAGSSPGGPAIQGAFYRPVYDSASTYCKWSVPASRDELAPFTWRENDMQIQQIVQDRLTQPYRGDNERYVFPAVGGDGRPLHPLLGWWALLFALSMLARYESARWTSHLERDKSPYAVPIEATLDQALHTCPELIAHAISAVTLSN